MAIRSRHFDVTAYKNKSGSDNAQVPADGTVDIYYAGSSVTQAVFIPADSAEPFDIHVHQIGAIQVGDSVRANLSGPTFPVLGISDAGGGIWIISSQYNAPADYTIPAQSRLVITNRRPDFYVDALGASSAGTTLTLNSSTGRAAAFTREDRFDYAVVAGGALRIYPDGQQETINGPAAWVNAADFSDLQDAVDTCATGGTVFIPHGDWRVPSGGLVLSRMMSVRGEPGTRLLSYSASTNQPVLKLTANGGYLQRIHLSDLKLVNETKPSAFVSGNYGIQADVPSDGSKIAFLTLERVVVDSMGDDGIHLHALGTNDSYFVYVSLREVESGNGRGYGLFASFANGLGAWNSFFSQNDLSGARCEDCEVVFQGCGFENNCHLNDSNSSHTPHLDSIWGGQAHVVTCLIARFDGCHFEQFTTSAQPVNKRGLTIENSPGSVVSNCSFGNSSESSDTSQRGIFCSYSDDGRGVLAATILSNIFSNVKTAIEIDSTLRPALDCVVFPQFIASGTGAMMLPLTASDSGTVVLGNRLPKSGSPLTLGKTRGMYLPALATADRPTLASEDAGYVIFVPDSPAGPRLQIWNGSGWTQIG